MRKLILLASFLFVAACGAEDTPDPPPPPPPPANIVVDETCYTVCVLLPGNVISDDYITSQECLSPDWNPDDLAQQVSEACLEGLVESGCIDGSSCECEITMNFDSAC